MLRPLRANVSFAHSEFPVFVSRGKMHRRPLGNLIRASCLICLAANVGCVQPHHMEFQVPINCIQFSADSFTGPCREHSDGKIVCDKVVITASCIQPKKPR